MRLSGCMVWIFRFCLLWNLIIKPCMFLAHPNPRARSQPSAPVCQCGKMGSSGKQWHSPRIRRKSRSPDLEFNTSAFSHQCPALRKITTAWQRQCGFWQNFRNNDRVHLYTNLQFSKHFHLVSNWKHPPMLYRRPDCCCSELVRDLCTWGNVRDLRTEKEPANKEKETNRMHIPRKGTSSMGSRKKEQV